MTTPFPYEKHEILLKIDHMSLDLGGKVILRDVNGEIADIIRPGCSQGQAVALLGPSGIGKTQLFRCISGLQHPTSGQVLVNNPLVPVKRGMVGVVTQRYPLFNHRTIIDNLEVAAQQVHDRKEASDRSHAMLKRFDLEDHANRYPVELSGGQRQRVAIAQQLLCSSHFLLVDEPFSGLDPVMVDEVCGVINEVTSADELNTVVVVTHDVASAVRVADTIWYIGRDRDPEGKIIKGARIVGSVDLIEMNLAWHPDISSLPEFHDCVRMITDRFHTL